MHRARITHRDIKPENVLVETTDEGWCVRIVRSKLFYVVVFHVLITLCCCVSCVVTHYCRMILIRVRNENSAMKSRHDVFCTIIAITALGLSMTDLVGALVNLSPHRDVALTDFGCATNAEKPSGWLACTLAYAAPELVDR